MTLQQNTVSSSSAKNTNISAINTKIENIKAALMQLFATEGIKRVGAGVSGGADSMVVLNILCDVCAKCSLPLYVLTVNHNVREESVSAADSDFVIDFCASFNKKNKSSQNNFEIIFEKQTIEPNKIAQLAQIRDKGEEEAARFLRYQLFEDFCRKHDIELFCLGHNKTDQLETLIQRFLQGAGVFKSAGIPQRRGKFYRPFLSLEKDEITFYAQTANIPFRFDATNAQNIYNRNKIRNQLVPVLNQLFTGWDTALLHGAEKAGDFVNIIEKLRRNCIWQPENGTENCVKMPLFQFEKLELPYRIEILYDALILVKVKRRITYDQLRNAAKNGGALILEDLSVQRKDGFIFVELKNNRNIQKIEKTGFYIEIFENFSAKAGCLTVTARVAENSEIFSLLKNDNFLGPFPFPCVLRNRQPADKIKDVSGSFKLLSKVFSDLKVAENHRDKLPVIEADGEIFALIGEVLGYENYLVKYPESAQKQVFVKFEM